MTAAQGSGDFDVVTGAFSYSGAAIARELQAEAQAMADGLADTDGPATGETVLTEWISSHKDTLGRVYANELTRHFR